MLLTHDFHPSCESILIHSYDLSSPTFDSGSPSVVSLTCSTWCCWLFVQAQWCIHHIVQCV